MRLLTAICIALALLSLPFINSQALAGPSVLLTGQTVEQLYDLTPDGTRAIYSPAGGGHISSASVAGGDEINLAQPAVPYGDTAGYQGVSPDGQYIAFTTSYYDNANYNDLYIRPLAGGDPIELDPSPVNYQFGQATFTADSSRIVYKIQGSGWNIYSAPVAGGTPVDLTASLPAGQSVDSSGTVEITSDNSYVVFEAKSASMTTLFGVPSAGGSPVQLSSSYTSLDWMVSPDSSRVVYRMGISGDYELYSAPLAGGPATRLNGTLVPDGDVTSFDFSHDGGSIYYRADQFVDEQFELFSIPTAGGTPTRLSHSLATNEDVNSLWVVDGAETVLYNATDTDVGRTYLYSIPSEGQTPIQLIQTGAIGQAGTSWKAGPEGIVAETDNDGDGIADFCFTPYTGGQILQLNNSPMLTDTDGFVNMLDFTDDGKYLLYLAREYVGTDWYDRIYALSTEGGVPIHLTDALAEGEGVARRSQYRFTDDGYTRVYLSESGGLYAATIPEPTTLAIMALGATILAGRRRRQHRPS